LTFEDRPYQTDAFNAILREWDAGNKNTLLVLPTGTGKTIVFCRLLEHLTRLGKRSLVLAHRGELLDQAADKLQYVTGLRCAREKADSTCLGEWERVVVGSVQSMMRPKRLARFAKDHFGVIIVDEAHHALADSYRRILDHFSSAHLLGVTATPDRGDMRDLGDVFDSLAYEYSLPQSIKDGFLCPIKALTIPLNIDISGVKQQGGDYQAAALGHALDPYLEQIADEMVKHCKDRKVVVFLPLITTSQKFCALLQERGLNAAEINGESRDRAEILEAFHKNKTRILCNSMLLTEGWDQPDVDTIVPLRPTRIRSLFAQMVGRGMRLHPGKDHLLLLDFLWNTARLPLCRPSALIAEHQDIADKMTENIAEAGCPVDIEEAKEQAEGDCVAEREEALAKRLAEQRHKRAKLVDPLQFEMSILGQDLAGYTPSFGWESKPVSKEQSTHLEKSGINPDGIDCAGKAQAVLDKLDQRRNDGLATPKQIRLLERYNFASVGQWQFESARKMIVRISASGWRVPSTINPSSYKPKEGENQ